MDGAVGSARVLSPGPRTVVTPERDARASHGEREKVVTLGHAARTDVPYRGRMPASRPHRRAVVAAIAVALAGLVWIPTEGALSASRQRPDLLAQLGSGVPPVSRVGDSLEVVVKVRNAGKAKAPRSQF